MYGLGLTALLVSVAAARPEKIRHEPSIVPREILARMTVEEASSSCGDNQQISCCNKTEQGDDVSKADGVLSGLLNGALGDLSLADQCSAISVSARKSFFNKDTM